MTFSQWRTLADTTYARATRIRDARIARAKQVAREAGLDPTIADTHIHNALVGLHYGKPWHGVDYSKVRLARRIWDSAAEPNRIAERALSRLFKQVQYPT